MRNTFILFLTFGFSSVFLLYAFQNDPSAPSPKETSEEDLAYQANKDEVMNLFYEGDYEGCVQAFGVLQKSYQDKGDISRASLISEDIATIMYHRPDLDFAQKLSYLAQLKQKSTLPSAEGYYYATTAYLYAQLAESDSVNSYIDKATPLLEAENLLFSIGNYYLMITQAYKGHSLYQDANYYINQAGEINQKSPSTYFLLDYYYQFSAEINIELGEYQAAINSTLKQLDYLNKQPSTAPEKVANSYTQLAVTYSYSGDLYNSLLYYKKGLQILEENQLQDLTVPLHIDLAMVNDEIGNTTISQQHFFKAIDLLQNLEEYTSSDLEYFINIFIQLGNIHARNNELDSAEHYIKKAFLVQEDHPYRAEFAHSAYAGILEKKKDYVNARKQMEIAKQIAVEYYGPDGEVYAEFQRDIARISIAEQKWPQALAEVQNSIASLAADFDGKSEMDNPQLSNITSKSMMVGLLNLKDEILSALEKEGNNYTEARYQTAHLAVELLEYVNRSFRNSESKKAYLTEYAIPLFENSIQIALKLHQQNKDSKFLEEAFQLSEKSKSMLMTGAKQEDKAASMGGIPQELIEQEDALQKAFTNKEKSIADAKMAGDAEAVNYLETELFDISQQIDELKHTFEANYPKYFELKYSTYIASIQQIQEKLTEGTTLLEFFTGDKKVYAFSINSKSVKVNEIEKNAEFENNSAAFQKALSNIAVASKDITRAYNEFMNYSHFFYEKIIQENVPADCKRLIIVPDGELSYIPFETMVTKKMDKRGQGDKELSFADVPYLLHLYPISYNYSATLMLSQLKSENKVINGNILAMASSYNQSSPTCRGERELAMRNGLIELPGAVSEIKMLQKNFKGTYLLDNESNEKRFKEEAPKHGIIHLAMHGIVNTKNPELSGLAMTENDDCSSDNFLYSYEIKQQQLQSSLVVLSACQTGIGKFQRGEGVVSIGRGFMYAGTPSLMMTLWSLNDQSGAFMIEQFYKNMSEGMEKDIALQQAKIKYLESCTMPLATHPFLWAPFIQLGTNNPIEINTTNSSTYALVGGGLSLLVIFGGLFFVRRKKEVA